MGTSPYRASGPIIPSPPTAVKGVHRGRGGRRGRPGAGRGAPAERAPGRRRPAPVAARLRHEHERARETAWGPSGRGTLARAPGVPGSATRRRSGSRSRRTWRPRRRRPRRTSSRPAEIASLTSRWPSIRSSTVTRSVIPVPSTADAPLAGSTTRVPVTKRISTSSSSSRIRALRPRTTCRIRVSAPGSTRPSVSISALTYSPRVRPASRGSDRSVDTLDQPQAGARRVVSPDTRGELELADELVDEAVAGLDRVPGDDLGRRPGGETDLDPIAPVVRPQLQGSLEAGARRGRSGARPGLPGGGAERSRGGRGGSAPPPGPRRCAACRPGRRRARPGIRCDGRDR